MPCHVHTRFRFVIPNHHLQVTQASLCHGYGYWIASWYGQAVHPSLKREAKTDQFLDIFLGKRGNSCNEGQDGRQRWLGIVWKSAKVQDDLLRESTRVAQALERKNTIVTDDGLAIGRWRFDPRQKRRRIFLLQILLVLNLSRSTC